MSEILDEVLAANASYARSFGDRAKLAIPPARRFAVLTCMDARLDPAKFAGLAEGDAHVIRNAGGRASDDAIRSLVISYKLLGTREWFVIHHSDCGLLGRTDEELRQRVAEVSGTRATFGFLPFTDLEQSVRDDIAALRASPYFPPEYEVLGFTYDVRTGELREVESG